MKMEHFNGKCYFVLLVPSTTWKIVYTVLLCNGHPNQNFPTTGNYPWLVVTKDFQMSHKTVTGHRVPSFPSTTEKPAHCFVSIYYIKLSSDM